LTHTVDRVLATWRNLSRAEHGLPAFPTPELGNVRNVKYQNSIRTVNNDNRCHGDPEECSWPCNKLTKTLSVIVTFSIYDSPTPLLSERWRITFHT